MAGIQHTHTCPVCGDRAERSVDYRRDGRWPETYSYCANGHAWTTKSQESEDHPERPGSVDFVDFINQDSNPRQTEEDAKLYWASKGYLHKLMDRDEQGL